MTKPRLTPKESEDLSSQPRRKNYKATRKSEGKGLTIVSGPQNLTKKIKSEKKRVKKNTGAARGRRVFLQILELLQDPFRCHTLNSKERPQRK